MTKQLKTTDWTLVVQYHQGNNDALAILFQKYFKYLYLSAFKILANRQDAEDCIQDVLLQLLNINVTDRVKKLKPNPINILPSLIMRVKNKSIDIWRKNKKKATSTVFIIEAENDFLQSEIETTKDKNILSVIFKRELEKICFNSLQKQEEKKYFDLFLTGHDRNSIIDIMQSDTIKIKVLRQRVMRKIKRRIIPYL